MSEEFKRDVYVKENILGRPTWSLARTGRLIFWDDFTKYDSAVTELWTQTAGTIALSSTIGLQAGLSGSSMKITTGTAENNEVKATLAIGYLPNARMGLEIWWLSQAVATNIVSARFALDYYDGATLHSGGIQWLGENNKKWQYMEDTGGYADITGGAHDAYVSTSHKIWHHLKYIIDFNTNKYGVLWREGKSYTDLDGIAIQTSSNTSYDETLILTLRLQNATATAGRDAYIGGVLITDQEA